MRLARHLALPLACLASLSGALRAAPAQGLTSMASVTSEGAPGDAEARFADISANGRVVAFSSEGAGFVPGDTNGDDDVFVHDRISGVTTRVSVSSQGAESNARSRYAALSGNGRYVCFVSLSDTLTPGVPQVGIVNVYKHDRVTATTTIVSSKPDGLGGDNFSTFPRMSDDGSIVAFISLATNLVPGDTDFVTDIYVRDDNAGTITQVSVSSGGVPGNGLSHHPDLSADGRFVTFASFADNLVAGDTNGVEDVFLHDRVTGVTTRLSEPTGGGQATGMSYKPSISGDGAWVVFTSAAADLVAGDTNGFEDVFLHGVAAGTTTRVSVSSAGAEGNGQAELAAISKDGEWVAFASWASNLVPGDANDKSDLFRYQRATGTVELMTRSSEGAQGDSGVLWPRISGDGSVLIVESYASNLVPGDDNATGDVFVFDRTPCPMPARVCAPKLNSQGCVPRLEWIGTPSLGGADDFHVRANSVLNQHPGLLIYGSSSLALPFQGGTLCVESPQRTAGQSSGGSAFPALDCTGSYDFHVSNAFLGANGFPAGARVYVQYWSRDTGFAPPDAVGLTRGMHFEVCP